MRGTEIAVGAGDIDAAVSRRALRTVLTASLVAAVDSVPRPARIELHARKEGDSIAVRVETCAHQGGGKPGVHQ
jgi:hypothetical protein